MVSGYELITSYKDGEAVYTLGYKLLKKLGDGTYGVVYLSEFQEFGNSKKSKHTLACKIIDTAKSPREYISKFLPRELEILRKVKHPHIIHVHSIFQKGSKYLVFMRYAENGDLLDFLEKAGGVGENQARMWVKQIALAIQYLHELEIAHRDLKCENILVTANYNVKVADFGFARFILNKAGAKQLSETYCGSASYSAPEILKGIPYNPKPSDLWSLGVIIYVIMNRALPFEDRNLKKIYEQQIHKKWSLKPHIEHVASKEVKNLLHHLLEPSVERRYTISDVLKCEWLYMDPRIIGMTEEETLALVSAKEERKKMDETFTLKAQHKKQPKQPIRS